MGELDLQRLHILKLSDAKDKNKKTALNVLRNRGWAWEWTRVRNFRRTKYICKSITRELLKL